jgi:hypothetical protein
MLTVFSTSSMFIDLLKAICDPCLQEPPVGDPLCITSLHLVIDMEVIMLQDFDM